MMMSDGCHPPVDRRRVEPSGRLVTGKDRNDVRCGRQRWQTMLRAPGGEDRPIGIISASRRTGAGRFRIRGRALDLFMQDRGQHRFIRVYGNERCSRRCEVRIGRHRSKSAGSDHTRACATLDFATPPLCPRITLIGRERSGSLNMLASLQLRIRSNFRSKDNGQID
jgi:hypothetical protein